MSINNIYIWCKGNYAQLILSVIAIVLAIAYSLGKDIQHITRMADAAIFEEAIENIHLGNGAVSSVFAHSQNFIDRGYAGITLKELINQDLQPPVSDERNMLKFHAYYILYLLSYLSVFLSSSMLLSLVQSLCFFGLLTGVSYFVYKETKSLLLAGSISLIVMFNPNWIGGIQGQFYPDRIFVMAGFILVYLAYKHASLWQILIISILVATINERAALIGGMILILFPLYDRAFSVRDNYYLRVGVVGILLVVYAYYQKQYVLSNLYYGTYLPANFNDMISRLYLDGFVNNIGLFVFNNILLILLSLAAPRLALLSMLVMIPNVIGNIGGAEKTGWLTHYHSYYFPILTFSAAVGFVNIFRKYINEVLPNVRYRFWYVLTVIFFVLVVHSSVIDKSNGISIQQIVKTAHHNLSDWAMGYPTGYTIRDDVRNLFEYGDAVSTTELGMALLQNHVSVSMFPVAIDKVDYLFIPCHYLREWNNQLSDNYVFTAAWLIEKGFDPESAFKLNSISQCRFSRLSS